MPRSVELRRLDRDLERRRLLEDRLYDGVADRVAQVRPGFLRRGNVVQPEVVRERARVT